MSLKPFTVQFIRSFFVPKKGDKMLVVGDYRKIKETRELDLYAGQTADDYWAKRA